MNLNVVHSNGLINNDLFFSVAQVQLNVFKCVLQSISKLPKNVKNIEHCSYRIRLYV